MISKRGLDGELIDNHSAPPLLWEPRGMNETPLFPDRGCGSLISRGGPDPRLFGYHRAPSRLDARRFPPTHCVRGSAGASGISVSPCGSPDFFLWAAGRGRGSATLPPGESGAGTPSGSAISVISEERSAVSDGLVSRRLYVCLLAVGARAGREKRMGGARLRMCVRHLAGGSLLH
ncbi:hypothetical protein chiPu_0015773 [Chiloscyllium punctatum]|uniref:Uncharacterized protein n=1 Tax=Chiloscyllium punctatum TaxID=137246 RepID=A0A401T3T2_CHIPU|nr:hypothetical protein [Chiloscyllium punctatum]